MFRPPRVVLMGEGSRACASPPTSASTPRFCFFCTGFVTGFEAFLFPFWEVFIAFSVFCFSCFLRSRSACFSALILSLLSLLNSQPFSFFFLLKLEGLG
ncbi:hypothetical protein DM02DRAFT_704745 [Periconia macrospinosa]|uniref:Uncharacterized protein n=1 Tax=Periconia macrospinosa TaxID=97972 RepID=A0A2V1D2H0_9PLEO|nr:hypothetical protein DM02DRAFT_704745 [Periconia macrospinosa]